MKKNDKLAKKVNYYLNNVDVKRLTRLIDRLQKRKGDY